MSKKLYKYSVTVYIETVRFFNHSERIIFRKIYSQLCRRPISPYSQGGSDYRSETISQIITKFYLSFKIQE